MADQAIEANTGAAAPAHFCDTCGRRARIGWAFAFKVTAQAAPTSSGGQIIKCFFCAVRHFPMIKRSLTVAVVVGTILTLLNQGDTILGGNWGNALYWKVPLTYCVPFLVASYGALTNSRR